jgi:flavin-binding protein dodecin
MATIAKVIEVKAEGGTIEEAVEAAVAGAARSVRKVQNVWVKDIEAVVEDNRVARYRVDTKVTFLVDASDDVR